MSTESIIEYIWGRQQSEVVINMSTESVIEYISGRQKSEVVIKVSTESVIEYIWVDNSHEWALLKKCSL